MAYANYSGSTGHRYRLWIEISQVSQNYGANTSVVSVTCRMDTTNNYGWFDSTNQTGNIVIHGEQFNFNSNYPSSGVKTHITQQKTVTHDANGYLTIYVSGYHNANQGSGLGTANVGEYFTLSRIPKAPTLTTSGSSAITPYSATVGGDVTDGGGATVTQRGIYYSSVSSNPTASHSTQTVTGTTGAFSTSLTGLTAGTLYYYRSFAINSQGTGYGSVSSFTTQITPYASMIYNNANPYADGKLMQDTGSGWANVTTGDLYFKTYSEQGATTVPETSVDPSTMITNALTYFNSVGGIVSDSSTVDLTASTSSYTFVSQSIYEVINKCLTLAPYNWYWYVDPATNYLHFHEKSATADHNLILGKDIKEIDVEKRGEDIVNVVYFTGGDTGGGSILYRKYQNNYSIGIYGQRATKIIDERVTSAATAELISENLLARRALPEVRLRCVIADSNVGTGAYNIETINVGDVINVQNVKGSIGTSLWDQAIFDESKYDFDVNKITSMNLQVVRKEYSATELVVTCSTIPPEVTKRIEDISRNLQNSQTINNPDTPS